jgi:DNA replication protein DnaC
VSERQAKKKAWVEKFLPMRITHPQVTAAQEALAAFCGEAAASPSAGRMIVIYGENGSGKSRLARLVSKWFNAYAKFMPLVFKGDTDEPSTPDRVYANWPAVVDRFHKHKELAVIEALQQANLAVLDDIGAEHDPSGFFREQLYLVLNKREQRWTLITTNVGPANWDLKFERRIASRLFRNAEHIDFSQVPDFSTV